jgi:hypothetical protein
MPGAVTAATAASALSAGGRRLSGVASIREKVRARQLAKEQSEASGAGASRAQILQLEHILQHVVGFVAGQKPSIVAPRAPHKTQPMSKAVDGLWLR